MVCELEIQRQHSQPKNSLKACFDFGVTKYNSKDHRGTCPIIRATDSTSPNTQRSTGKNTDAPNTQRTNSAHLFSIEERQETLDSATKEDCKEESNSLGSPSGLFVSESGSKENNLSMDSIAIKQKRKKQRQIKAVKF